LTEFCINGIFPIRIAKMADINEREAMNKTIKEALASEQVLNLYANGFICSNSNADVIIILKNNDKTISVINLSYTTAKTLSEKLGYVIREFEKTTGMSIMTINVIDDKLKEAAKNVKLQ
jgi:hypothetical protein